MRSKKEVLERHRQSTYDRGEAGDAELQTHHQLQLELLCDVRDALRGLVLATTAPTTGRGVAFPGQVARAKELADVQSGHPGGVEDA